MKIYPLKQGLKETALQEDGHKVTPISIESLAPGKYRNVTVKLVEGRHLLQIPSNMDGSRFKLWKRTDAGIFSRDLLRFTKGKASGEWLLIQGKKYTSVVRLIDDSENTDFDGLMLLHGKIKDAYYMHLKTVLSTQNINWAAGYINQSENEPNDPKQQSQLTEAGNPEGEQNKPNKLTPMPGPLFK